MSARRRGRTGGGWTLIWVQLLAMGLGLAAGLVVSWWLWPVEYTDMSPDTLHSYHRTEYIKLISHAYAYDKDLRRAQVRLAALGDLGSVGVEVVTLAEQYAEQGKNVHDTQSLARLAHVLGHRRAALAPFMPGGAPTPTWTPWPTATPTATEAPTATPTPVPTSTPTTAPRTPGRNSFPKRGASSEPPSASAWAETTMAGPMAASNNRITITTNRVRNVRIFTPPFLTAPGTCRPGSLSLVRNKKRANSASVAGFALRCLCRWPVVLVRPVTGGGARGRLGPCPTSLWVT